MTSFNVLPKSSRQIFMLTAGIVLIAATQGAVAKDGGHSDDRGGMRSADSGRNSGGHDGMKSSESNRDRDHGDKYSQKHRDKDPYSDERQGNGKEYSVKTKDKDKTSGTSSTANKTPPAPGTGGTNTIHPIPSPAPIASGTGSSSGVTPPANTIHPIPSPPPGGVTVSNGVTKYELQNGPGGVAVYSSAPGTITVTNGTESKTLPGGSLTLSGNVIGVGAAQGIQVGARNGEGNTVIAIKPQPASAPPASSPPAPKGGLTGTGPIDEIVGIAGQAKEVGKDIGNFVGENLGEIRHFWD